MLELLKKNRLALLIVYLPGLLFLLAVALQNQVPISYLTRDPAEIMGAKSYIGFVSNLGILNWCAAAAIAFFTATLLFQAQRTSRNTYFFFACAGISTVLMLDDLLLFHERLAPNHLHIPQLAVVAGYGLMLISFLAFFKQKILETQFLFLLLFVFFLGISALSDGLSDSLPQLKNHLLEDGAKFLGIISWLSYVFLSALTELRRKFNSSEDRHF